MKHTLLTALLASFLAAHLFAGSTEPPIDVDVFYSKEDPHWKKAEETIEAVNKKFPRLRIKKTSIDTPEGYKKLAEAEALYKVKEHGDLTIMFGPIPLTSKGAQRNAEAWFESVVTRALNPGVGKGRLPSDPEAFVVSHFGSGAKLQSLKRDEEPELKLFRVKKGGDIVGYVVDAYAPIACPMCNDVQFLLALEPDLKIIDVKPVRALELMGTPMDEARAKKYLDQFKGLQPAPLPPDIDGIARATRTTQTYEATLHRLLNDLKGLTTK